jgi:hypothetical protein
MNSRLIQAIALAVMIAGAAVAGRLLPPILRGVEASGLRYTDVAVEGAPPLVTIGTMIGALRGLIVDILWIKIDIMKSRGLFYEVMADAELITKLQPRFAQVWAFHGHNMIYNISVATHTQEERWDWVNAGIRLVRNEGLRYNPNDIVLHKELAFWFSHKIEGSADDAHLYYKREFAREWHYLLGEPPADGEDRIAWIKGIADAPDTLEEAIRRTPEIADVLAKLEVGLQSLDGPSAELELNANFLMFYGDWLALSQQSEAARLTGRLARAQEDNPFLVKFGEIADDPELQDAWQALLEYVRKRVLLDEYNMDPALMHKYTAELGPIDWRHGDAHALYWSRRGTEFAETRSASDDDIYQILNNDRVQMQAMQSLARTGRITYDPYSVELPARYPEPRWIEVVEDEFERVYSKHYETRGGGPETFITFLENFLSSAVREAYRSGEYDRAQGLLDRLDERFGTGALHQSLRHTKYKVDLDVFVRNEIQDQYAFQPHLAPSEAVAALRHAFRAAVAQGYSKANKKRYDDALVFVDQVIEIFRSNEYYDFETKFGTGRMRDLLAELGTTKQNAFIQLMADPLIPMVEKQAIWQNIDAFEQGQLLRLQTYDFVAPVLSRQFTQHERSLAQSFEQAFPPPPGLEQFRAEIAAQRLKAQEAIEKQRERDEIEKRGTTGQ